jgi:hypothetical protein
MRPRIRVLAERVGAPSWAIKKRARELGLTRTKEKPWSDAELQILTRYAWISDDRIRLKLKQAGYARTATAVHLKLKRGKFKTRRKLLFCQQLTPWGWITTRSAAGSRAGTRRPNYAAQHEARRNTATSSDPREN